VGTIVRGQLFYDTLIARLLADAELEPLINPPRGVEVAIRQGDDRRLLFLVNHTDKEQRVKVPAGARELLSETETAESLVLEGFGVAVVRL
jgi:beta-galactosidase GanA